VNAQALYQAGQLEEAVQALGSTLRSNPGDVRARTFLFELLCFAGEYERAAKQLDIIADSSKEAGMGALLYRSALHAERTRQEMFLTGGVPAPRPEKPLSGTLNGQPFHSITDADPRVGARLEVFAAGQYTLVPFEYVASLHVEAPKRLRDLLWAEVRMLPSAKMQSLEAGELLMPVLTPGAAQHPDPEVRLGRVTEIELLADGREVPAGQKILLVDDTEVPILELRELVITPGDESV
jgi:type VI secretion system protein ImpE